MASFITRMILKQRYKSVKAGQDKYRAYFIRTYLYEGYRDEVDKLLDAAGYADCITKE